MKLDYLQYRHMTQPWRRACRWHTWAILLIVLSAIVSSPAQLRAADGAIQASNITIGFDGTFRLAAWTPIEFDLTGPAGTVISPALRAVDPDGQGVTYPLSKVTLADQNPVHVRGLFRSGKLNAVLQLQLYDGDRLASTIALRNDVAAPVQALKTSTSVWVAVGDQPLLTRGLERWTVYAPESAHLISLAGLEQRIWSESVLDGVDVVMLNGDAVVDAATSDRLQKWVAAGGRLIIPVGDTASKLAESPLAKWLPLTAQGQTEVAKLTGLQELVPRSGQLRTLTTVSAALLDRTQGQIIANGLSGPLAMRAAYGSGQVTLVAVRMDEAPLSNWEADSQAQLAAALANIPLPWEVNQTSIAAPGASDFDPSSVTDLQGQLNQSLDNFDGIQRAVPWAVIGWIALFALLIGPIDYLVVRHWLRKPEWTWATMLFWTVLGSVLAISRANALNAHAPVSRQFDSLDIDLTSGSMRGESWFSFYNEHHQRRRISAGLNPDFLKSTPKSSLMGWVARPGDGFRGMSGSGGLDDTKPQYRFFDNLGGIDNFPVRKWSTGMLNYRWQGELPRDALVEGALRESGVNRLTGTIQHHLPGELSDWFLAYGNFAYFERPPSGEVVKPLPPGTPWNVGQSGSNLLRGRVVTAIQERTLGIQLSATDDQIQRTAYHRSSTDPAIVQLVTTFYQAAGGESYTKVKNTTLKRLDLSETIALKRAVLFGRLKISPTLFQVDGEVLPAQEQSVMVRIILPVQQEIRDKDAPPAQEILQLPK